MAKDINDLVTTIRGVLQSSNNDNWENGEIKEHIASAVREFSLVVPAEQETNINATLGKKTFDISVLEDYHEVVRVEYPLGQDPPHYVNFNIWKDNLTMQQNSGAGDTGAATFRWLGPHTVDAAGSTLKRKHETIIIQGAAAHCLVGWLHKGLDAAHATIQQLGALNTAVGLMTARIVLGRAQLDTMDEHLVLNYPKIDTLITAMGTELTLIIGDIVDARASVAANLDAAVTAAGHISDPIATAVTASGSSLERGEFYIDRITVGGGVSDDWANYARAEMASGSLYAQQAHAFIAADRGYMDKLQTVASELGAISGYAAQIKAYDDYGNPNKHYGALASKYFEDAGAALIEVQGNMQGITANLQVANVVANYCRMADLKLEAWRRGLIIYRPYRLRSRYGLD